MLILLVAGALALAAAIGLADMAGYPRLVERRPPPRPGLVRRLLRGQVVAYFGYVLAVRDIARADGGPLLSLRLSMQSVVAGFGVFAATHAAGGFSVDYWTFRRSGLRRREAVERVLALGALEYAVLAPAALSARSSSSRHRRSRPGHDDPRRGSRSCPACSRPSG